MKIKILIVALLMAVAAAVYAQDKTGWDDWIELQKVSAQTIAMHNPSAVCELDWIPAPDWTPVLSYDVCLVAGYYDPEMLWLVMSVDDTGYVGRRFWVIWSKGEEWGYNYPIQHYQADESHVIYFGHSRQPGTDFDTLTLFDIDARAFLDIDVARYAELNRHRQAIAQN